MKMQLKKLPACLLLVSFLVACGKDSGQGIVPPGEEITQEHWWDNFLDESRNPITLASGFKLVKISGTQRTATPLSTAYQGMVLDFAIDPDWRSNLGFIFRGNDQNQTGREELAGAVELIKDSGWLRTRETFDWTGLEESPPGSFKFVRVNRFTQSKIIRSTFNGFAADLMLTLLSEPYIAFPTDTAKTWNGKPVHVSDGSGTDFLEIISYRISYLGTRSLTEKTASGTTSLQTYNDVILLQGKANNGQGEIDAYLAPNVGIIYYHLVTAFGQEGAGALIGFSGDNQTIDGSRITDYFPTSPGNHWIYEFSPDNHVPQFRFSVY